MIANIFSKIVCMIFGVVLFYFFSEMFNRAFSPEETLLLNNRIGFMVAGALFGVLVSPWFKAMAEKFHREVLASLKRYPPESIFSGFLGVLAGGLISSIVSIPVYLAFPHEKIIVLAVLIGGFFVFGYPGALIFARFPIIAGSERLNAFRRNPGAVSAKVLDSSVIIDGRVAEIIEMGLIEGEIIVPAFIVEEVQNIADSKEPSRKKRGRRGLEAIGKMREDPNIRLKVDEAAVSERGASVDSKLISYAQARSAVVFTNDRNLEKAAAARGVHTINIHALSSALRPWLLPGDRLEVEVVKYGKEAGQGIAYLDDGAMVVIESGDKRIGDVLTVEVTSLLQTAAGRLVFSKII